MSKHEVIDINDFKVILNYDPHSKTTMVESYISSGFINENIENACISHLLEHVVTEGWKKCGKAGRGDLKLAKMIRHYFELWAPGSRTASLITGSVPTAFCNASELLSFRHSNATF